MLAISEKLRGSSARRTSEGKRRAILQGGKAAFLKCGFGGTSMDTVAEKACVTKMTVYRHFKSKEELFAGVITELCEQIVDENLDAMFEQKPAEALRAFGRKMTSILFAPETVELHRIVIAESLRFPKLGQLFYASGPETSIAVLSSYFSNIVNKPRFKIRDPRRSAEEFLELLRGYAHLRVLLGIDKAPPRREIETRIEVALRHVLKTPVD